MQTLLDQHIQQLLIQLSKKPDELYEPMRYILGMNGKRLRPALVLMATDLFDGDVNSAMSPALGIEVFHNFTLLHDDIMDNAPLRRNQPTVHEKWNTPIAILSGDAMFVKANQLMCECPTDLLPKILQLFNHTALQVCEGQQLDMNYEKASKISMIQYTHMIGLKTAVLVAAALKMGAWIGGAREEDAQRLYEFGYNLGVAFQLQDDVLDVYADKDKFGKQVGGDIISNKKTYLLIKAQEMANRYMAEELEHWLQAPHFNADEKVKAITDIYNFLGIKQLAEKEIERLFKKSLTCLTEIPASTDKIESLKQFAHNLMGREI